MFRIDKKKPGRTPPGRAENCVKQTMGKKSKKSQKASTASSRANAAKESGDDNMKKEGEALGGKTIDSAHVKTTLADDKQKAVVKKDTPALSVFVVVHLLSLIHISEPTRPY